MQWFQNIKWTRWQAMRPLSGKTWKLNLGLLAVSTNKWNTGKEEWKQDS